jgi:hypothetical protein
MAEPKKGWGRRVKILEDLLEEYRKMTAAQDEIIKTLRAEVQQYSRLVRTHRLKSNGMTGEDLMQALERAGVAGEDEIRFEVAGDDNGPQEIYHVEPREHEGVRYTCILVRNA